MSEKTLCIIKPDAVENNFVDQINEMIESKGRKKLKRELLERNLLSQFLKMRYMVQTHQNLQTEKLK